jgi:uncharacterized protein
MLIRKALSVTLLLLGLLAPRACEHQRKFLPAKGWVSDFSNVIDTDTEKSLTALCVESDRKTHAQIAVVTVESLGGTPIESYALALFNEWGIGHKEDNRGILILLATSDHQWRIQTGRGLETLLPNARVGEIGEKMTPDLRERRYSKAVLRTAREIAGIIAKERGVILDSVDRGSVP